MGRAQFIFLYTCLIPCLFFKTYPHTNIYMKIFLFSFRLPQLMMNITNCVKTVQEFVSTTGFSHCLLRFSQYKSCLGVLIKISDSLALLPGFLIP